MFSVEVDRISSIERGHDGVVVEFDGISGEAAQDFLQGIIDDGEIEIGEILVLLEQAGSKQNILDFIIENSEVCDILEGLEEEDILDYVVENNDVFDILEKLDENDVLNYVLTIVEEPKKLTKVLNAIVDEAGIEALEEQVIKIKKKLEKADK
jgi:hypothetical protein